MIRAGQRKLETFEHALWTKLLLVFFPFFFSFFNFADFWT